jgi:hypothetical protein
MENPAIIKAGGIFRFTIPNYRAAELTRGAGLQQTTEADEARIIAARTGDIAATAYETALFCGRQIVEGGYRCHSGFRDTIARVDASAGIAGAGIGRHRRIAADTYADANANAVAAADADPNARIDAARSTKSKAGTGIDAVASTRTGRNAGGQAAAAANIGTNTCVNTRPATHRRGRSGRNALISAHRCTCAGVDTLAAADRGADASIDTFTAAKRRSDIGVDPALSADRCADTETTPVAVLVAGLSDWREGHGCGKHAERQAYDCDFHNVLLPLSRNRSGSALKKQPVETTFVPHAMRLHASRVNAG